MADDKKNPKDLDGDGEVTDKEKRQYEKQQKEEREEKKDTLERDLFNSEYSWAADLVYSNDRLKELWKTAIKEGWTATKFIAKFKDTGYYQNHTEEWLKWKTLKETKPLAYKDAKRDAAAKLRDDAAAVGVTLSEKRALDLADMYMQRGFSQPDKAASYREWLAKKVKTTVAETPDGEEISVGFSGSAGQVEAELLKSLNRNGFTTSSDTWKKWVDQQVRRIVAGNGNIEDAQDYVRRTAATRYPSYSQQMINEGKDAIDFAQGYIDSMSEILEIPGDNLGLNDPKIKQAMMGGVGEDGKPTPPMSLWDFEKSLKSDERWRYTKNANEDMSGFANHLLKSFGFMG